MEARCEKLEWKVPSCLRIRELTKLSVTITQVDGFKLSAFCASLFFVYLHICQLNYNLNDGESRAVTVKCEADDFRYEKATCIGKTYNLYRTKNRAKTINYYFTIDHKSIPLRRIQERTFNVRKSARHFGLSSFHSVMTVCIALMTLRGRQKLFI